MIAKPKDLLFITWLTLLALSAVAYAFIKIPSPATQRAIQLDAQRVSDLSALQNSIEEYYNKNKVLPQQLTQLDLTNYNYDSSNDVLKDPQTEKQYEYKMIETSRYQLCATFDKASPTREEERQSYARPYTPPGFTHPKGYYCFPLNANAYSKFMNNIPIPQDGCSGQSIAASADFQKNKQLACGQYADTASQAIMGSLGCNNFEEAKAALNEACGLSQTSEPQTIPSSSSALPKSKAKQIPPRSN